MFEIIKNVIKEGRYNLAELLLKIETLWVQGSLTDEQKTELVQQAQENADFRNSFDILAKLEELDERVRALEEGSETKIGEEFVEYVAGKWYYNGDKVTFNGKNYVCTAPGGQVCTWSPSEYPTYWDEI